MVDTANIYLWCWDARPFPFFPSRSDVWGDTANYMLGHWLNGRLGAVLLSDLVTSLCADAQFTACDVSDLDGLVTGYAVTDTMSPRDAIGPLSVAYQFDAVEREGEIVFVARGRPMATPLSETDLVVPDSGEPSFGYSFTRAEETDLPLASRISYIDGDADYRQAVAEARRLVSLSDRVAQSVLPIVMDQGTAIGIAGQLLQDAWVMRETGAFSLPPSRLALDAADEVSLSAGGRSWRLRVTEIDDAGARTLQVVATDPSIYELIVGPQRAPAAIQSIVYTGRALVAFLDLPLLIDDQTPWAPYAAALANPWPGAVLIFRSASDSGYALDTTLLRAASIGETTADFDSGPTWRWDETNVLQIRLYNGALSSTDDISVFGGANAIAVENADGDWEVLQFANAGLSDELHDRHYLIVEGMDGRAHYIDVGLIDPAELPPDGGIAAIVPVRASARPSDRTVAEIAAAHDGRYSAALHREHDQAASSEFVQSHVRRLEALRCAGAGVERHADGTWSIAADHVERVERHEQSQSRSHPVHVETLSSLPVEKQVKAVGATWLDHELTVRAPTEIRDAGFGHEARQAIDRRRQWLIAEGLAREDGGRTIYPTGMIAELLRRDVTRAGAQLSSELGLPFAAAIEGERVSGTYKRRLDLASGRFALITNSREFTLVPWHPVLEQSLDKQVSGIIRGETISWNIGRQRSGPTIT